MNVAEAERAFREMLPCETVAPDISLMRTLKLGVPIGITMERDKSLLTKTFLVFQTGENCLSRYQIEFIKLCEK